MSEKNNVKSELKTGSSFDKKKTETEQLYNDMTGKAEQEADHIEEEETEEQAEEELLSEEQLEIQREIESYQRKIETLDAKLEAHKSQHIDAMKREQMKERYYSDRQIESYIEHISGTSKEEIIESIDQLEIPPANDNFADPSAFNGRAAKPKRVDPWERGREIGKEAFKRIKHRIFH